MSISIRRLDAHDAPAYRALRLEALSEHPEAFGSSHSEEAPRPLSQIEAMLAAGTVFGGFFDGTLSGLAGLYVPDALKTRHKAVLWGPYVPSRCRGLGMGAALVDAVLTEARRLVEEVTLSVGSANKPALRLYRRVGFVEYGTDRRALKLADGHYIDELLMQLRL